MIASFLFLISALVVSWKTTKIKYLGIYIGICIIQVKYVQEYVQAVTITLFSVKARKNDLNVP